MIPFKPIRIKDKDVITSFTIPSDFQNCDYSFANILGWQFLFHTEYAIMNRTLFIRFQIGEPRQIVYMVPIGQRELSSSIHLLEEEAIKQGYPLSLLGVTPDIQETLNSSFPNDFSFKANRNYFDYIYLREDLATLKGKKFQSKRNLINNFNRRYKYEYIPLTTNIIQDCIQLEQIWFANQSINRKDSFTYERQVMRTMLNYFKELDLIGGAIQVNNQIIAFAIGAPINHNTFSVHIEKADINYKGAYAVINKELASHLPNNYIYINREEDLGIPGLRQAKLSYNPIKLLEKSIAIKRKEK
ncbi:MAG: DUF2156 domain-containing protein [Parabacteroides distasonis]|nr:DUF2156 domain-containing protein [Parabacteroides distasonis]